MKKIILLVACFLLGACVAPPTPTKSEITSQTPLFPPTTKRGNYLRLARYWDDHAEKQSINFVGASFLTIREQEGKAEITIGSGPYYGLIELIRIDTGNTLIRCYGGKGLDKRIGEWKALIENAPEKPAENI